MKRRNTKAVPEAVFMCVLVCRPSFQFPCCYSYNAVTTGTMRLLLVQSLVRAFVVLTQVLRFVLTCARGSGGSLLGVCRH